MSQATFNARLADLEAAITADLPLEELARLAALVAREADSFAVTVPQDRINVLRRALAPRFPCMTDPDPTDMTPLEGVLWNCTLVRVLKTGRGIHTTVGYPMGPGVWERITGRKVEG